MEDKKKGKDVRIFNVTAYGTPEEGDPIMAHKLQHIPDSQYLDLRYLRDMSKPYPMMIPTEKHFSDYMKEHNIKLSTRVVVYDTKAG